MGTGRVCKHCGKEIVNFRNEHYCNSVCSANAASISQRKEGWEERLALKEYRDKNPRFPGMKDTRSKRPTPKARPEGAKYKPRGNKTTTDRQKAIRKDIIDNPVTIRVSKRIPPKRTNYVVKYDFLKYHNIIFRWVRENFGDINRNEVNILLFLYTEGAFSQSLFVQQWKPMSMYPKKAMNALIQKGYLKVYRERRNGQKALYSLTTKSKDIVARMHTLCVGDTHMSESPRYNAVAKNDKDIRTNTYYMELVKKMNKNKPPSGD